MEIVSACSGLHLSLNSQASVLGNLQLFGELHYRLDCNPFAFPVVEVKRGADGMVSYVDQHQIGRNGSTVGEMGKLQSSRSRSHLDLVGRGAGAGRADRPYLEEVDSAVSQLGDRMGQVGGFGGYPTSAVPLIRYW